MPFYLTDTPLGPPGFIRLSRSSDWEPWIGSLIPEAIDAEVRRRVISNLKHILVGLEMKAALIFPHVNRGAGRSLLFEPYFQVLTFEFCVGTFSVCEGLGAINFLAAQGEDGADERRITPNQWIASLTQTFDPENRNGLALAVEAVKEIRDRLHQDRLGARENIDWHVFGLDAAFRPACTTLNVILLHQRDLVPDTTNLANR